MLSKNLDPDARQLCGLLRKALFGFLFSNHAYCVAETGYQTGKVGPKAPARDVVSGFGSCLGRLS